MMSHRQFDFEICEYMKNMPKLQLIYYYEIFSCRYWSPGPEADFIEDLRYFRGFIQIQNMLDQGIIALQSTDNSTENKYEIYTQQFPYSCWRKDS